MTVWDSLKGSRAAEGLIRQIASGDIAHAWLLLGPAGAGKRPAAVAIAAALNCAEKPETGCGECSTCRRISRHRHPDVHHVTPEGPLIPVDVIREAVIPEAARSPFEARRKVFIIEEADKMNASAQNALLKTLEEPQADTVFVLLSDQEEEVLDTIASRCRIVRFERVPEKRIVELLGADGVSHEDSLLAARLSEGDMERARPLALDEATAERRRLWAGLPARLSSAMDALDAAAEIVSEARDAVKALERSQKKEIEELAGALGEGRGTAPVRNAVGKRHKRELRRLEEEILAEALQALASFYRDVLLVRRGGTEAVTNIDLVDELDTWARSDVTDAALVAAVERCITARASFTHNANALLQIEATLLALARLAPPRARLST